MNKYGHLLLVIAAAFTAFSAFKSTHHLTNKQVPAAVEEMFSTWANTHGKTYATPKERFFRLGVFFGNLLKIESNNANPALTHTEGLNKFADMTHKEFSIRLGLIIPENRINNSKGAFLNLGQVPASVDHRTANPPIINEVKDQGQCGSCWAFSAITSLESRWAQDKGHLFDLAEQQLVDCSTAYGNNGCNGGLMDNAFRYIEVKSEEQTTIYPYHAVDQNCRYKSADTKVTEANFSDITKNSLEALTAASVKHVIAVAVDAQNWSFYTGGIFSNCGTSLDHGVAVVGYGVDGGKDFWIIRNSWASSWGEDGYIRIARNTAVANGPGTCGVRMMASIPLVE